MRSEIRDQGTGNREQGTEKLAAPGFAIGDRDSIGVSFMTSQTPAFLFPVP
jgi:hypothetical protein